MLGDQTGPGPNYGNVQSSKKGFLMKIGIKSTFVQLQGYGLNIKV